MSLSFPYKDLIRDSSLRDASTSTLDSNPSAVLFIVFFPSPPWNIENEEAPPKNPRNYSGTYSVARVTTRQIPSFRIILCSAPSSRVIKSLVARFKGPPLRFDACRPASPAKEGGGGEERELTGEIRMAYSDKMRSYMEELEEERRKIQVFPRELPLCLKLVVEAIERCKRQLLVQGQSSECDSGQTSMDGPVLAEFIPLKGSCSGDEEEDDVCGEDDGDGDVHHSSRDDKSGDENAMKKSDWLRSVQLWNPNPDPIPHKEVEDPPPPPSSKEAAVVVDGAKSHENGAFRPFQNGEKGGRDGTKKKQPSGRAALPAPDAAAGSTAEAAGGWVSRREDRSQGKGQAAQRKQRRCWSPELHRFFVQALQQLGGPHVATPKQIREVMKVDGLTNDEVKSHLQKFRLHTRRPSPDGHGNPGAQAPQFVVVGGIWMQPPDFTAMAVGKPPVEAASNRIYAPVAMHPQPLRPSHKKKRGLITSEGRGNHGEVGVDHLNNSSSITSSSTHTTADFLVV